jgi:hypothetical protein
MTISQTPDEILHASILQSKCELKRVALRQCQASAEVTQIQQGPFSLRVSHNSVANAVNEGILRIEVRFQIECYDAASPSLVFDVHCSFILDYEIEDRAFQPSSESIIAFKDGNAIFNCWSYTREFFQNIASRMEFAPPPLPLLRIVPQAPEQPTVSQREVPRKLRRRVSIPIHSEAETPTAE